MMKSNPDLTELAKNLSNPDSLTIDIPLFEQYCRDATTATATPMAIVWAETEADVIAVAVFCSDNGIPLVPRGAGTGLSGGCVPSHGGIVLSTERLTELSIDPVKKMALAGPGVITKALVDAAEMHGLTYPPDPASFDESTLGGNVAENAGGLRCRRFGVTRDYVLGIRAVTIDGQVLNTGYFNAGRGFGLGDVIVGNEGTLAVITRLALRLIDRPDSGVTFLAAFDSPRQAAQAVSDIMGAGVITTVLEYLDGDAAACSNEYEKQQGLENVAALLLIEVPSEGSAAQEVRNCCQRNQSSFIRTETDPDRVEQLWRVRRNLSKATKEIAAVRVSEDVAVPISQFPKLVEFVDQMNQGSSLRINSYGHAGDGNLHVNFLSMTGEKKDHTQMLNDIVMLLKKAIALGGTLSGEHGIGLAKRDYFALEFDEATRHAMGRFKICFDPESLLNPGKIF